MRVAIQHRFVTLLVVAVVSTRAWPMTPGTVAPSQDAPNGHLAGRPWSIQSHTSPPSVRYVQHVMSPIQQVYVSVYRPSGIWADMYTGRVASIKKLVKRRNRQTDRHQAEWPMVYAFRYARGQCR